MTLDGLNLDIAGMARSVDDYEDLLASLGGGLPGGAKVVSNEIKPAAVSPYGWAGRRGEGPVRCRGAAAAPRVAPEGPRRR